MGTSFASSRGNSKPGLAHPLLMSNQIELSMFQDYHGRLRKMLIEEERDPHGFKTVL
jgi:hypothetical protein